MIALTEVCFAYPLRDRILDKLSLRIPRGERVCLLGRNGSGKSTLLKLMAGLLSPESGDVFIDGISSRDKISMKELRTKVGFIFQNPEDQIIATKVESDIAFALENLAVEPALMKEKVHVVAERFSLVSLLRRHPATLSGGEKQRAALASVTVVQPEVLLLDEPTSFLDYRGRQRLFDVIFSDKSITVVAATQYPNEIAHYDRVLLLDNHGIAFDCSRDSFYHSEFWHTIQSVRRTSSCAAKEEDKTMCPTRKGGNSDEQAGISSCPVVNPANGVRKGFLTPPNGGDCINVADLSFSYSPDAKTLDQINLSIPLGKITTVMGDSGCGKTTLALLLANLVKPNSGEIKFPLDSPDANKVAVLFQFPETGFFADTVLEEVAFGIKVLRLTDIEVDSVRHTSSCAAKEDEDIRLSSVAERVRAALSMVGLSFDDFAQRNPFTISAGEKRRVAIASVLIMDRPVIIFDETTLGLDWEGRKMMAQLIDDLKASGKTIILMTHDYEFAAILTDYFIFLDKGLVVWQGYKDDVDLPRDFMAAHFGAENPKMA